MDELEQLKNAVVTKKWWRNTMRTSVQPRSESEVDPEVSFCVEFAATLHGLVAEMGHETKKAKAAYTILLHAMKDVVNNPSKCLRLRWTRTASVVAGSDPASCAQPIGTVNLTGSPVGSFLPDLILN